MENKDLEGWVFMYQPYAKQWWAVKREHYGDLWNFGDSEHILKADTFPTMRELIIRTQGDKDKLNQLVSASQS